MKTDLLGLGNLWIRKQLSPLLAEIYFPPNNKCLTKIITLLYYFLLLEGYTYVFPGIKKRQIYLSLSLCNYLLDMHTQSSFSDGPSIYS